MIDYRCPCGTLYEVSDGHAGRAVECYKCGRTGIVSPHKVLTLAGVVLSGGLLFILFPVLSLSAGAALSMTIPGYEYLAMIGLGLLGAAGAVVIAAWTRAAFSIAAAGDGAGLKSAFSLARRETSSFLWTGVLAVGTAAGGVLLLVLLGSFSDRVKVKFSAALSDLAAPPGPGDSFEELSAAVRDRGRPPEERWSALGRLAGSKDPGLLDLLIEALGSDPDSYLREKAAVLLGETGDRRAAGPLRQALSDDAVVLGPGPDGGMTKKRPVAEAAGSALKKLP